MLHLSMNTSTYLYMFILSQIPVPPEVCTARRVQASGRWTEILVPEDRGLPVQRAHSLLGT